MAFHCESWSGVTSLPTLSAVNRLIDPRDFGMRAVAPGTNDLRRGDELGTNAQRVADP